MCSMSSCPLLTSNAATRKKNTVFPRAELTLLHACWWAWRRSGHQLRRLHGPRSPGARERARLWRAAGGEPRVLGTPRRAEFLHASHAHRFARRSAVRWARSLQPGHGDLATVGVSGPAPMGFVVRRVEESTPVSQQLQHPLRGEATHAIRDPGKFSSALRAAYFALHARLGLRSAARTAVRTVARMAGAKRRTEQYTYQSKFSAGAPTQGVANNPQRGRGCGSTRTRRWRRSRTRSSRTRSSTRCVGLWCAAGMRRSPSR